MGPYVGLQRICHYVEFGIFNFKYRSPGWTFQRLQQLLNQDFFPNMQFLTDLRGFEGGICLGPYGLHPLIDLLQEIEHLLTTHLQLTAAEAQSLITIINPYAISLRLIMDQLRRDQDRSLYDPPPIACLRALLLDEGHILGVSPFISTLVFPELDDCVSGGNAGGLRRVDGP
jgi:hypothetical protein